MRKMSGKSGGGEDIEVVGIRGIRITRLHRGNG